MNPETHTAVIGNNVDRVRICEAEDGYNLKWMKMDVIQTLCRV